MGKQRNGEYDFVETLIFYLSPTSLKKALFAYGIPITFTLSAYHHSELAFAALLALSLTGLTFLYDGKYKLKSVQFFWITIWTVVSILIFIFHNG